MHREFQLSIQLTTAADLLLELIAGWQAWNFICYSMHVSASMKLVWILFVLGCFLPLAQWKRSTNLPHTLPSRLSGWLSQYCYLVATYPKDMRPKSYLLAVVFTRHLAYWTTSAVPCWNCNNLNNHEGSGISGTSATCAKI